MTDRFQNKTVLITGGAGGIGRVTALAFASEGGRVAVADLDLGAAEAVAAEIRSAGGEALAIQVDISREADVTRMVAEVMAAWGRLDVAFNNAGVDLHGPLITELEEAEWDRVLNVNLKGLFFCLKHEIPAMVAGGGGAIVNTSSLAGVLGAGPGLAAYVASKHGVVGLTRNAAMEWIKQGVRINAICPGAVLTPILEVWLADPGRAEAIRQQHPIGRWAEPEEIAKVVLFLSCDESSFIVGQPINIDGGVSTI